MHYATSNSTFRAPRPVRISGSIGLALILAMGALLALPRAAAANEHVRVKIGDPAAFTIHWLQRSVFVTRSADAQKAGEYGTAVELATRAIALPLGPRDRLAALNLLCTGHTLAGSAPAALPYCDRLVAESGGDWRGLNNRANALLAMGRDEAARGDYERALALLRGQPSTQTVTDVGEVEIADPVAMLVGNLAIARARTTPNIQLADAPRPVGR
jgi:tetratricopeptide (TPR) repeat protein